jgi:hypothetical protein
MLACSVMICALSMKFSTTPFQGRHRVIVYAGIPTMDSSINIFSTASYEHLKATNSSRQDAVNFAAAGFGIDSKWVHGRDWLQILTNDDDRNARDDAAALQMVRLN